MYLKKKQRKNLTKTSLKLKNPQTPKEPNLSEMKVRFLSGRVGETEQTKPILFTKGRLKEMGWEIKEPN